MSIATPQAPVALDIPRIPTAERLRFGLADTVTLTRRDLLIWFRNPAFLFFTFIQPVMFVLLFRYVFGGAIPGNVPGGYVAFLMPGSIAQSAAFASWLTKMIAGAGCFAAGNSKTAGT